MLLHIVHNDHRHYLRTCILITLCFMTQYYRYPKLRSYTSKDGRWSLTGIAKGAGMIEPNMATMLCFLLTDLDVPREVLQILLERAVDKSFNCISIDGELLK